MFGPNSKREPRLRDIIRREFPSPKPEEDHEIVMKRSDLAAMLQGAARRGASAVMRRAEQYVINVETKLVGEYVSVVRMEALTAFCGEKRK